RLLSASGWDVVPLRQVADMLSRPDADWSRKSVGVAFDDGSDFDYADLPHPIAGKQRSMLNIMRDFKVDSPLRQPTLHATSFVIVSPEAREILDRTCMLGTHWWNHTWWPDAVSSGLMDIASHSWDHCHDTLPQIAQRDQRKGDFWGIDTETDAEAQIRASASFIAGMAPNRGARLFAYPYGHAADFLVHEYFPRQARDDSRHCIDAAFSTDPEPISRHSNRWNLGRFVCGDHWRSSEDLAAILRNAF
ncbi:MAG: polysaccharide deacetylase family protein, partial [Burkholderiales bacterium]|nr:polysaccharide deacetylase family protein [Burkholderiales bacterium]